MFGVGGTYVFTCWLVLSNRNGVSIERNLKVYRFILASIDSSKKITSDGDGWLLRCSIERDDWKLMEIYEGNKSCQKLKCNTKKRSTCHS